MVGGEGCEGVVLGRTRRSILLETEGNERMGMTGYSDADGSVVLEVLRTSPLIA